MLQTSGEQRSAIVYNPIVSEVLDYINQRTWVGELHDSEWLSAKCM